MEALLSMKNKSVFSKHFLIVILGFFSLQISVAQAGEQEVSLHMPWPLFQKQMSSVINHDGQPWNGTLPDFIMNVGSLSWQVSGVHFDGQASNDASTFDGQTLVLKVSHLKAQLTIERFFTDSTIVTDIGGNILRTHFQAVCGPLVLSQPDAQASAEAVMDWSSGDPTTHLNNLQLSWANGSWGINDFHCDGPADLVPTIKAHLMAQLQNADAIRPLLADWLASQADQQLQSALKKIRAPFQAAVGSGLNIRLGRLRQTKTGLLGQVFLNSVATITPTTASVPDSGLLEKWSDSDLAKLAVDQPTILAPVTSVQGLLNDQLELQPAISSIKLNDNESFASLLDSRFLQLFLWADLWSYSKTSPFYLRVQKPASLKLKALQGVGFETDVNLKAIMQSYRDNTWWNYVDMTASAHAVVQLDSKDGVLSYTTTLKNPSVQAQYSTNYVEKYHPFGWLPTDQLTTALQGGQSGLSNKIKWPQIDLGTAGVFQAGPLKWLNSQTITIPWKTK